MSRPRHPASPATAQLAAAGPAPDGPAAPGPRHGTALCLSGGGYRAALFHLGAVRRLNELGVLGGLRSISGVSGGALTANLLADSRLVWPDESGGEVVVKGFERYVADPLRRLAGHNVRTPALLAKLWPPRWFMPDSAVRALAGRLAVAVPWWAGDLRDNAPDGPAVLTCATEVAYGVSWIFADPNAVRPHGRVGDYRLGHADPPPGLRIADAVAATCAYPPFFAPQVLNGVEMGLKGGDPGHADPQQHAEILRHIELTDGGAYDTLGVEAVWADHATVLVSDGGTVFRARTTHTVWGQLLQILGIATSGGQTTRLRWLQARFAQDALTGASWSLDAVVPGHYPAATTERINAVRTDLDAFSDGLQQVLERHGYLVADQAVREHAPRLIRLDAPLEPPHPQVADAKVADGILRGSSRRTLLGRF
ncbi:patatin-like phospholipase family protein [Segeticoccus rhizosphaerae]|uniref:patatin-like phospholipase family protein n=1 Tax=Segeticoccus rhizosphaerae TaxID=1104777 RepID=UPI0012642FA2|nr:patatin-like phospholipase family protein [Segeticoccus rhizosphaerae]